MKALHLVKTSTGARWALIQMIELKKIGFEIHVAMPTDGCLIKIYNENGIIVHPINYNLKKPFNTLNRLRQVVKHVNPNIIHSHFLVTTLFMRVALRNSSIPRLFQVPGPLHLENIFFRNIELITSQKNDFWIASCKWTLNRYLKSGINPKKVFLSYYGTDIHFKYQYYKGKLKKDLLGLNDSDILVGIVAYMYAPKKILFQNRGIKGHEDLIDAIAILSTKYPNLYCVCIGGPWVGAVKYENEIKKYANKKAPGKVFFTGTMNNVKEIYNDLFCVIHPSHSENLGGAAESLLLGVPTICTNIGGFPDIVKHGITGLLVPPKSPNNIAQAIESLIENKYNIDFLIKEGRLKTTNLLDIKNTTQTIKDIYNDVLHL